MDLRYKRFLNDNDLYLDVLKPREQLNFLISDYKGDFDDSSVLDLQIRENNELMYYHGTTRLLTVKLKGSCEAKIKIRCKASDSYRKLCTCYYDELMHKDWSIGELNKFKESLKKYLNFAVKSADDRYYKNKKEGYWQNKICNDFGTYWSKKLNWLIIDREAVIGHADKKNKEIFFKNFKNKYEKVVNNFRQKDPKKWGKPSKKNFGDELDLLAIGPKKELVCIELKHGDNPSGIYWGLLQVAMYRDSFNAAISQISDDIINLVNQKIKLELLPKEAEARIPKRFSEVKSMLAIAKPKKRSSCWGKLIEVVNFCPEVKQPIFQVSQNKNNEIYFKPLPLLDIKKI